MCGCYYVGNEIEGKIEKMVQNQIENFRVSQRKVSDRCRKKNILFNVKIFRYYTWRGALIFAKAESGL